MRKQGWGEVDSDIIKPLRTVKSHGRFSGCIRSHTFPVSKFQRGAEQI